MNWQERLTSKMNRSSWKTAHEDAHPQVDENEDLQSHLMSHHQGDHIGDVPDHEWFHCEPQDYTRHHREVMGYPMEDHWPDHYHSNDYGDSTVPDSLPPNFASFEKLKTNDA